MIKKILLFLVIFIVLAGVVLFLTRHLIFDKVKTIAIKKIEFSTGRGIKIERAGYVPVKGIRLDGISVYKTPSREKELLFIERGYVKFSFLTLVKEKLFSPDISINKLKIDNISASGRISFSLNLSRPTTGIKPLLDDLGQVRIAGAVISRDNIVFKNINGLVLLSALSISSKDLSFSMNDMPHSLDFDIKNPLGEFSSSFKLSAENLSIVGSLDKKENFYKIPSLKGVFLNSSFSCMGEIKDIKAMLISLYGEAKINLKDIASFIPAESKSAFESIALEGVLSNSVYCSGSVKDMLKLELGIKSSSDNLKIKGFAFERFSSEIRLKDGVLEAPAITAYPYKGKAQAVFSVDLKKDYRPYFIKCAIQNVDMAFLVKDTKLKDKQIRGLLFAEAAVRGEANNSATAEGQGSIRITNANLGPMPLLTPLLGNLYGYLQTNVFTDLKKIDITEATADFYIANRKIATENLILWGDTIIIHAYGYVDFDKRLNFDIENEFVEPEETEEEDWQASLQEAIAQFGKIMSKARLTGTLDKPEWKFEYFGGIKEMLKNKLGGAFKNIFE